MYPTMTCFALLNIMFLRFICVFAIDAIYFFTASVLAFSGRIHKEFILFLIFGLFPVFPVLFAFTFIKCAATNTLLLKMMLTCIIFSRAYQESGVANYLQDNSNCFPTWFY